MAFDHRAVRAAIARLLLPAAGPAPMLKAIGVAPVRSVQKRLEAETAPDGTGWAPLLPAHAAGKTGPATPRQAKKGGLQGSITPAVDGQRPAARSNEIHAALHPSGAAIVPKNASRSFVSAAFRSRCRTS